MVVSIRVNRKLSFKTEKFKRFHRTHIRFSISTWISLAITQEMSEIYFSSQWTVPLSQSLPLKVSYTKKNAQAATPSLSPNQLLPFFLVMLLYIPFCTRTCVLSLLLNDFFCRFTESTTPLPTTVPPTIPPGKFSSIIFIYVSCLILLKWIKSHDCSE